MKILIRNKVEFNKFMEYNGITDENVESKNIMLISINDPGKFSYFKEEHLNVKIIHFWDLSEENIQIMDYKKDEKLFNGIFNEKQAKELYKFIVSNKDKDMALIHCSAGISRSGGIGTFIFDLYGTITWEEFKRKNPYILPNAHILKLLRKELHKDK